MDLTSVTSNQKLLVYTAGICPSLLWDFGTTNLPISWVAKSIEATATHLFKWWSGLARSADPSHLYRSKKNGGLNLPKISTIYKKAKFGNACQLFTSQDSVTRHVSKISVMHEESLTRENFRPMLAAREVMADDLGVKRSILAKRSRNLVVTEDNEDRLANACSLIVQGQLHHLFRCTKFR